MGLAEELEAAAAAVRQRSLGAVVGIGSRWPSGSGLIYGEGLVVTSAHNVHGEATEVHFFGGARRPTTAAHLDRGGDLAVLEVPTEGLTALSWADGGPQLGTPVFAAANPGGRGMRLSFGVVSAEEREFRGPGGRPISGSFEHTAPLPHGSSGGPVLSLAGDLLGVNTKRLGEGLYAAITTNAQLRQQIDALAKGEPVSRAYLGVGLIPSEAARRLRAAVGLPERNGVLVQHLDEEGPAAGAGVRRGDLLTKANGLELARAADLHRALAAAKPGDQVQLELERGAEAMRLAVNLGSEPERSGHEGRGGHFRHHR
ncbi:MAG: S1C family serine protease [Candidatus Dormibacteria bacterium]